MEPLCICIYGLFYNSRSINFCMLAFNPQLMLFHKLSVLRGGSIASMRINCIQHNDLTILNNTRWGAEKVHQSLITTCHPSCQIPPNAKVTIELQRTKQEMTTTTSSPNMISSIHHKDHCKKSKEETQAVGGVCTHQFWYTKSCNFCTCNVVDTLCNWVHNCNSIRDHRFTSLLQNAFLGNPNSLYHFDNRPQLPSFS